MSTLLFILWYCILMCSVGYFGICSVLTKDITRLVVSPNSRFQLQSALAARRRNMKFSVLLIYYVKSRNNASKGKDYPKE